MKHSGLECLDADPSHPPPRALSAPSPSRRPPLSLWLSSRFPQPVPAPRTGGTVNLVAYSTPKPAYTVLAADFAKTSAGGSASRVSPSFGPSGTQATSVVDGLGADVVNFSLDPTWRSW